MDGDCRSQQHFGYHPLETCAAGRTYEKRLCRKTGTAASIRLPGIANGLSMQVC